MKKLFFLASAMLMLASCGVSRYTSYTAKSGTLPYSINAIPTTSELSVSEKKVSGEARAIPGLAQSVSALEKAAVADALNKVGADILLEPRYEYVSENRVVNLVKVWGYPAKFNNFHTLTKEEAEVLQKLNSTETTVIIKEKEVTK